MVLLLPLKANALSQHVEEVRGRRGDYIPQDAEGTRFPPRMNDAVKCILLSDPTMTNWPPAMNQGSRYSCK